MGKTEAEQTTSNFQAELVGQKSRMLPLDEGDQFMIAAQMTDLTDGFSTKMTLHGQRDGRNLGIYNGTTRSVTMENLRNNQGSDSNLEKFKDMRKAVINAKNMSHLDRYQTTKTANGSQRGTSSSANKRFGALINNKMSSTLDAGDSRDISNQLPRIKHGNFNLAASASQNFDLNYASGNVTGAAVGRKIPTTTMAAGGAGMGYHT